MEVEDRSQEKVITIEEFDKSTKIPFIVEKELTKS